MPGYMIATYDVTDPEGYAKYSPGSLETIMGTIAKHGGKVLVAGGEAHWYAGERKAVVVVEFPTFEAAKAWEEDPEYGEVRGLRIESTSNRVELVVDGFKPPSA